MMKYSPTELDKLGAESKEKGGMACVDSSKYDRMEVRNGYLCDGSMFYFEKERCIADQAASEARAMGNSFRRLLRINKIFRDRLEEKIIN